QLVDTRRLFAIPTNAADPAAADSVAAAELAAARRETFGAPYRAFFGSSTDEYVPGSTGAPPVFDKNNSGSTDKPKVNAEGNAIVDADESAKIKVLPFVARLAPLVLEKNATHSLFSEFAGLLHEANDQLKFSHLTGEQTISFAHLKATPLKPRPPAKLAPVTVVPPLFPDPVQD
ncbi:hypothetical protein BC828DRAFT_409526, partial [Blastocladiella britannica]